MKLVVLFFFIVGICFAIYLFIDYLKNLKKINWAALKIAGAIGIMLFGLLVFAMLKFTNPPDTWCTTIHNTDSYPPSELKTSTDYFVQGNYDYDTGNCKQAVVNYSKSIALNPKYPQALNNKAYAEMRMQSYQDALNDLDTALTLNPNYINALMNRGDIYSFYIKNKSLAIADYNKIISLVGTKGTSVCGHLFLAEHDGWNLGTLFAFPGMAVSCSTGR